MEKQNPPKKREYPPHTLAPEPYQGELKLTPMPCGNYCPNCNGAHRSVAGYRKCIKDYDKQ